MKYFLLATILVAGCGSDPLPPSSPCTLALSNFYSHGCLIYTEPLGQPLSFPDALDRCSQWLDLCGDLVDCLRRVPSGIGCGDCNGYLFECKERLDNG